MQIELLEFETVGIHIKRPILVDAAARRTAIDSSLAAAVRIRMVGIVVIRGIDQSVDLYPQIGAEIRLQVSEILLDRTDVLANRLRRRCRWHRNHLLRLDL